MPNNPASLTAPETRVLAALRALEARVAALERSAGSGVASGLGSPEGVLTAPVGTLYRRLDGGAGSTLYVKESGSGSAGWAAK